MRVEGIVNKGELLLHGFGINSQILYNYFLDDIPSMNVSKLIVFWTIF